MSAATKCHKTQPSYLIYFPRELSIMSKRYERWETKAHKLSLICSRWWCSTPRNGRGHFRVAPPLWSSRDADRLQRGRHRSQDAAVSVRSCQAHEGGHGLWTPGSVDRPRHKMTPRCGECARLHVTTRFHENAGKWKKHNEMSNEPSNTLNSATAADCKHVGR